MNMGSIKEGHSIPSKTGAQTVLGLAIMTLNWTWAISTYTAVTPSLPAAMIFDKIALIIAGTASMAATFMILGFLRGFAGRKRVARTLDGLGVIASVAALLLFALWGEDPDAFAIRLTCWISCGAASAIMLVKLGVFFSTLDQNQAGILVATMLVATSVLFFIITSIGGTVASLLTCLCLALGSVLSLRLKVTSQAMLRTEQNSEGGSGDIPISVALGKGMPRISRVHFFAMLFYGVAFGYSSLIGLSQSTSNSSLLISTQIVTMLAALHILTLEIWKKGSFDYGFLQWPLLILIVVGLLPLPYAEGDLTIFFTAVLLFGFACYDVANWLILSDLSHRHNPLFTFGFGRGFLCLGLLAGRLLWWVTANVASSESFQVQIPIAIVILLFCTIIIISLPVLRTTALKRSESPEAEEPDAWSHACRQLASGHGLTARETEVFQLLAKGWSQKAINEKLVISPHTAKAHVSHIYSKLGVHSRQELMRMVEEAANRR